MKTTAILLTFFLIFTTKAELAFEPGQQIFLYGDNCSEITTQAQSILEWTGSISSALALELPDCYCSENKCLMDVAPISPYFVISNTNFVGGYTSATPHNGPNCFNAALVASKTVESMNFTDPQEMTFLMQSPLCKERGDDEELQPGDIIAVRDQSNPMFEVHAGIYISDDLAFSKYGISKRMPYSYGQDVMVAYGVRNPNCRRVEGIPAMGDECYNQPFVNYFSCGPSYSFVSDLSHEAGGINELVRQLYATVSSLESQISRISYQGEDFSKDQLSGYQKSMRSLYRSAKRLERKSSLSNGQRTLASMMKYRLISLFGQTRSLANERGYTKLVNVSIDSFLGIHF